MKKISIIILLFIESCVFLPKMDGIYRSNEFTLILNEDNTYHIDDLTTSFSKDTGVWKLKNKKIILTSKLIPSERVVKRCLRENGDSIKIKIINQFGGKLIGTSLRVNDSLYIYEGDLKLSIIDIDNMEIIYLPFTKSFEKIEQNCTELEFIIYDANIPFKRYYINEELKIISDTTLEISLYGRDNILKKVNL